VHFGVSVRRIGRRSRPDARQPISCLRASSARAKGLAAVFTFPLRHGDGCIGAINAQARERADTASDTYLQDAFHDPLTGLPNRVLLMERVSDANLRAKRSQLSTVVFFVDLDRFKLVNDHHGHHVGDELLVAVARRFSNMLSGRLTAR
jgi:GGDEF domain-containing protein